MKVSCDIARGREFAHPNLKANISRRLVATMVFAMASISGAAHADTTVMMSGGFALAYEELLPEFERTTGIHVVTKSGASQGNGPSTIKAKLARGEQADIVILSREGLEELSAMGRIVPGTSVGLATSPLGAAIRTGTPKVDVSTVPALKATLLNSKLITMPGSTSGVFIKDTILPKLGIADKVAVQVFARGEESVAALAAGKSDIALGPVSELVRRQGVDYIGPFPEELQLVQEFTAAIVQGSQQTEDAKRLIAFLSSSHAAAAVHRAGMNPLEKAAPPQVVKEMAPTGKLRAAINYGNPVLAQKDPATGEPRGVSADLSRELAKRLGVPVEFVPFEAAGKVSDAAKKGLWDIAFLAVDPDRATDITFSNPYVVIEGAYLVPANSPLTKNEDVDREGIRIAVGKGSAYDLFLTRAIKKAQIVRAPTSPSVIDLFRDQKLEVAAGVRQQLLAFSKGKTDVKILDGHFMEIKQAIGIPKGRDGAVAYVKDFVEEAKASGFVADALTRSNQRDASVAPPVMP